MTWRVLMRMAGCLTIMAGLMMMQATAQDAAPAPVFKAGFARVELTPPIGSEIPGGFAKNISQGVHDPLWAEVALFARGDVMVALVGVDLIMIPRDVVLQARELASQQCGIPSANIMIGASHTHNGGPVIDCLGSSSDPAYCTEAGKRIADAVVKAHAALVPAQVAFGVGQESTVGFNRRFKMKDGTVKTHPGKMNPDIVEPAGPMDPDVGVIVAQDLDGKLLGCVVNHALHGTTMGGSLTSADWTGYLRSTIRGGLGADIGVVFLNGACGDVTQVDNRSPRASEFGEAWSRRVGMTVGAEALKVIARAEFADDAVLDVAAQMVDLPIRELAPTDEEVVARETPAFGLGGEGVNATYLKEVAMVRKMREKSPVVNEEIQAIRIGPVAVAANPAEYFCALGLSIKERSPWKPTFVVELANGCVGYSPTAEAFTGGGYEVRTARSSFLAPGAGEQIVDASVALLQQLASRK